MPREKSRKDEAYRPRRRGEKLRSLEDVTSVELLFRKYINTVNFKVTTIEVDEKQKTHSRSLQADLMLGELRRVLARLGDGIPLGLKVQSLALFKSPESRGVSAGWAVPLGGLSFHQGGVTPGVLHLQGLAELKGRDERPK